jgi:hypothetical protein
MLCVTLKRPWLLPPEGKALSLGQVARPRARPCITSPAQAAMRRRPGLARAGPLPGGVLLARWQWGFDMRSQTLEGGLLARWPGAGSRNKGLDRRGVLSVPVKPLVAGEHTGLTGGEYAVERVGIVGGPPQRSLSTLLSVQLSPRQGALDGRLHTARG